MGREGLRPCWQGRAREQAGKDRSARQTILADRSNDPLPFATSLAGCSRPDQQPDSQRGDAPCVVLPGSENRYWQLENPCGLKTRECRVWLFADIRRGES